METSTLFNLPFPKSYVHYFVYRNLYNLNPTYFSVLPTTYWDCGGYLTDRYSVVTTGKKGTTLTDVK